MNRFDAERMERAFHVEAIPTGGIKEGVILKFKHVYFKIYDGKGFNYSVQVWQYGKQMPDIVSLVGCNAIYTYIPKIVDMYNSHVHRSPMV